MARRTAAAVRRSRSAERQAGTRRDLDQLLVAPLDGAFALAQVTHAARAVADDLDLDMARARDQLLDEKVAVAEGAAGFRLAAGEGLIDLIELGDGAHPASAAAGDRLDHHRTAGTQGGQEIAGLVQAGRARGSGQHGNAGALGQQSRLDLVAEELENFGPRADESDTFLGAAMGELRIFTEKAVARMDRIATRGLRNGDDLIEVEIGGGARTAQGTALVGLARMQRGRIVLGKYRERADSKFGGGAHYPDRDFTAIGDQQIDRHHRDRLCSSRILYG